MDPTTTRRTLLAGGLTGSALGGLALASDADAAVAVPTAPAVDFFLALAGIPGDSQDARFPGTFEVLDWTHGAVTSVSPTNTGGGVGKVKPKPFVFVKHVDQASPHLFKACATGRHLATATLTARRRAAKNEFLVVSLRDVFVSGYVSAPGAVDAVPLDVVTLDYRVFRTTFFPQNPDGSLGSPVTVGFDYVKNTVL